MEGTTGASRRDVEIAVLAAEAAGRCLLDHLRRGVTTEWKDGGEPVTVADREADEIIAQALAGAFPDDALLSEERDDDGRRFEVPRVWIVDPLDGTRDFVAGREDFAVHIALVENGRPVLGIVHRPAGADTWVGIPGEGAYARTGSRPLARFVLRDDAPRLRLAVSRRRPSAAFSALLRKLGGVETVPSGSAGLKGVMVAEGVCQAYVVATPHLAEWDACAPEAVIAAAGGTCSDLLGRPVRYNRREPYLSAGFVAVAPTWQGRILTACRELQERLPWLDPR